MSTVREQLAKARIGVDEERTALRKVEDELRQAILERRSLEPSGLFARFRGSPDPQRLDELTTICQVLEVELRDRRKRVNDAREVMEQLERRVDREALVPDWITDETTAAEVLAAHQELVHVLGQLGTMAGGTNLSRDVASPYQSGRMHRLPSKVWRGGKEQVSFLKTSQWEEHADRAELLGDRVGLAVALPRRSRPAPRPPGAPPPDPALAAAREAAITSGMEMAAALERVGPRIQQFRQQSIYAAEALRERFPDLPPPAPFQPVAPEPEEPHAASEAAIAPPPTAPEPTPPPPAPSAAGPSPLHQQWEALRRVVPELRQAAGGRTVQLLDPVGRWQTAARAVAQDPEAIEHGLVPPVNDGMDLASFVAHVLEVWPELDARFTALDL